MGGCLRVNGTGAERGQHADVTSYSGGYITEVVVAGAAGCCPRFFLRER